MEQKIQLEECIESIDQLCKKMVGQENYQKDLPECVGKINAAVGILLKDTTINSLFLVQLLQDMMGGIENQDEVRLLDVLRFGIKLVLQDYMELIG